MDNREKSIKLIFSAEGIAQDRLKDSRGQDLGGKKLLLR